MVEKEFDNALRSIVQMDYGLVLISHSVDKTFTDEYGNEFNQIVPTVNPRGRKIASRMTDIIGYAKTVQDIDGKMTTKLFMRGTPRYMAGSRFKYTPDCIDFTYKNLVEAIGNAIDKQMQEDGTEYFTDTKENLYTVSDKPNYDELMETFNNLINSLVSREDEIRFKDYWQPRIVEITDKYLGHGKKVSQCTREQTQALSLIIDELKDLINNNDK